LGVPYLNIILLLQEVKAAEDLKLTVTRSSSKKMASKVGLQQDPVLRIRIRCLFEIGIRDG
jgi:hypothetical protein